MAVDAHMLHDGPVGFSQLSHSYEEKIQSFNAQAEVAKELLKATEEREKKNEEEKTQLQIELQAVKEKLAHRKSTIAEQKKKITELQMKVDHCEPALKTTEDIWRSVEEEATAAHEWATAIEARAVAAKEKAASMEAALQDAAIWAINNFRKSVAFGEEVAEGSAEAYQVGFAYYKAQVAWLFPDIDLSKVVKEVEEEIASLAEPDALIEPASEPTPPSVEE